MKTLYLGLSPLYNMSHDHGFEEMMWISLGHGLHIIDHDYEKSYIIFPHGARSFVYYGPKDVKLNNNPWVLQ
jgi:hypothetical protein